jgi:drug/metabolite transporter (DMT)-like permease
MKTLPIAILSIALSVAAQFCLKAGMSSQTVKLALAAPFQWRTLLTVFSHPGVMGGFALYGLGAVVWLSVLARWEVSKAYPLVGLGFLLTTLVGIVLGEQVGPLRIAGAIFISGGVWMIAKS